MALAVASCLLNGSNRSATRSLVEIALKVWPGPEI